MKTCYSAGLRELHVASGVVAPRLLVVEPGLVLIKRAIDGDMQRRLAALALAAGREEENGFWKMSGDGRRQPNNGRARGRIYGRAACYPPWVRELCLREVARARAADPHMPEMEPTHLVLLYYMSAGGKAWHRDDQANDGRSRAPVVSLSLGDACDFSIRSAASPHTGTVLRLESGDAVLFGGPCRFEAHAVTKVHPGTSPKALQDTLPDGRLNFTYRDAPEVLGREREFTSIGSYAKETFGSDGGPHT